MKAERQPHIGDSRYTASKKSGPGAKKKGMALVVVLSLIVLMLGVVMAFFSQSVLQRQISSSSSSQMSVDLFAQGAFNTIVGDLKREIADGSDAQTFSAGGKSLTLYRPKTQADVAPAIAVAPDITSEILANNSQMENLVKISSPDVNFASTIQSRASQIRTDQPSLNQRFISRLRWNKPLLMKAGSLDTPTPPAGFPTPSWVYVTRDGKNTSGNARWSPLLDKREAIVGRYAFVIYNEGGLLDANVAGYSSDIAGLPSKPAIPDQKVYKSALTYADLTQLKPLLGRQDLVDKLVKWRNAATFAGGSDPSEQFYKFSTENDSNFLSIDSDTVGTHQTDRMFVGRQQLIDFFRDELGGDQSAIDALQYLGTFSRSLNQPSFWPSPGRPKIIGGQNTYGQNDYTGGNSGIGKDIGADTQQWNPPFQKIRVGGISFIRNDGSSAVPGEPLVKKRFALNRLCWLTPQGPSASAQGSVRRAYIDAGVSEELLNNGTPENIEKYFGLQWTGVEGQQGGYWIRYHENESDAGIVIKSLDEVSRMGAKSRDPDFFELLKAAVNIGSLAKGLYTGFGSIWPDANPITWNPSSASQVDLHVIQLGLNIIDQANPTQFPTRIQFKDPIDPSGLQRFLSGNQDLPYFDSLVYLPFIWKMPTSGAPLTATQTKVSKVDLSGPGAAGTGVLLAAPAVWNPYDENSQTGSQFASMPKPGALRVTIVSAPPHMPNNNPGSGMVQGKVANRIGNTETPQGLVIGIAWNSRDATALDFSNSGSLYRDPTLLFQMGVPTGSSLRPGGSNQIFSLAQYRNGFLEPDPTLPPPPPIIGFFIGTFPLQFNKGAETYAVNCIQTDGGGGNVGQTLRMEYKSEDTGQWISYQEVGFSTSKGLLHRVPVAEAGKTASQFLRSSPGGSILYRGIEFEGGVDRTFADTAWDPRTNRFGTWRDAKSRRLVNAATSTLETIWPNAASPMSTGRSIPGDGLIKKQGFYDSGTGVTIMGRISKNSMAAENPNTYYSDADGVVRRAMAAHGNNANPLFLPQQKLARPLFLHRPYRSVAELGYVFRDVPWKNIDFSNPESGDAALLDVFCINDPPVVDALAAGKIDLNTRQFYVLKSILAGAYKDELDSKQEKFSDTDAETIAKALVARTSNRSDATKGPLANIAELIGRWQSTQTSSQTTPIDGAKAYVGFADDLNLTGDNASRIRESAIRALSENGTAGTWNLMIDLIAQTGRCPNSTDLAKFQVEGERRYWVHVAIDRLTGKVIDKQIEQVSE